MVKYLCRLAEETVALNLFILFKLTRCFMKCNLAYTFSIRTILNKIICHIYWLSL